MNLHSRSRAFTLIEMLTVMAVIAILASLIVAVNGYAHKKSALVRAEGEIRTMMAGCENYRADTGDYPRDYASDATAQSATDLLCPYLDGDPRVEKYHNASLVLYKALSGDGDANGKSDDKAYCEFAPNQLRRTKSGEVQFIQDPFGNAYGYSTNAASVEESYRLKLQRDPRTKRPRSGGYSPNYDLWSTAGVVSSESGDDLDEVRKRWVKNW